MIRKLKIKFILIWYHKGSENRWEDFRMNRMTLFSYYTENWPWHNGALRILYLRSGVFWHYKCCVSVDCNSVDLLDFEIMIYRNCETVRALFPLLPSCFPLLLNYSMKRIIIWSSSWFQYEGAVQNFVEVCLVPPYAVKDNLFLATSWVCHPYPAPGMTGPAMP